jgi:hypothetical protein
MVNVIRLIVIFNLTWLICLSSDGGYLKLHSKSEAQLFKIYYR